MNQSLSHATTYPTPPARRRTSFKRYRVYVTEDSICRVRKAFTTLPGAMKAAAKISVDATYAEVHDDALSMNERLKAVFKRGNLLGQLQ